MVVLRGDCGLIGRSATETGRCIEKTRVNDNMAVIMTETWKIATDKRLIG